MNLYLTETNEPSEFLKYTLEYYDITLEEFKNMSDSKLAVYIKKYSDVFNNGLKKDSYKGDSGSYSRYFSLDSWWNERIKNLPKEVQDVFPFLIIPKASKSEKNTGCNNLTDEVYNDDSRINKDAIGCNNPTNRSGKPKIGNTHVAVKPLKLFSYLTTLGSRPNDIILDPFSGSGTLGVACHLLNRNFICIDIEPDYVKIAKARIEHIQFNRPHVQPVARTEIL